MALNLVGVAVVVVVAAISTTTLMNRNIEPDAS